MCSPASTKDSDWPRLNTVLLNHSISWGLQTLTVREEQKAKPPLVRCGMIQMTQNRTQRYSLRHQWRSQNVVLSEKRNTIQPVIKLWKSHSWWTHASVTHTGLLKVIYLSSTKEKPHKYIFQWGVCTFVCHILPPTIHTTPKILQ